MSEIDLDAELHRDWQVLAGVFAFLAAASVIGAAGRYGVATAVRWGTVTAAVAGGELLFLRRHLRRNHPEGEPDRLHGRLGAANLVTVVRGGCFAALAGFVAVSPDPTLAWLPALCYGVGVTLDRLDGTVARSVDRVTVLGTKLDMAFDTLGFLVAPIVGVLWGRLPVWYLSLAAARYVFKLACWLRARRGLPVGDLPPSDVRRSLAGVQMGFISVALVPVVPAGLVAAVAPLVLVPSLAYFLRDYLAVTGRWSA